MDAGYITIIAILIVLNLYTLLQSQGVRREDVVTSQAPSTTTVVIDRDSLDDILLGDTPAQPQDYRKFTDPLKKPTRR